MTEKFSSKVKLGSVLIFHNNRRVPLSSVERMKRKGIYPYYGAQGVIDSIDDFIFEGEYLLIAEDGANLESRTNPICLLTNSSEQFWVNNHAHILTTNDHADVRYIKYYINKMDLSPYITGSAQPKLSKTSLMSVDVLLPDITKQKLIASMLSSLDDKIEVNNKINSNLEELAHTLYKRWFVDFEFPNEEGKPYKSSGGEMVESELGLIPKGWNAMNFDKIFDISYGKSKFSTLNKTKKGLYNVYGAGGILSKSPDFDYEYSKVIIGCRGTCGNVTITNPKSKITHNSLVVDYKQVNFSNLFRYLSLKNTNLDSSITGSTQPQITIKNLSNNTIILPKEGLVRKFDNITSKFHEITLSLEKQNQTLTKIRDLLLPKLMSGEIEV